jgi:hypothetical protein
MRRHLNHQTDPIPKHGTPRSPSYSISPFSQEDLIKSESACEPSHPSRRGMKVVRNRAGRVFARRRM